MFATKMTAMLTFEEESSSLVVAGQALKNAEHIASSTRNSCSEEVKERIDGDDLLNAEDEWGEVTVLKWSQ